MQESLRVRIGFDGRFAIVTLGILYVVLAILHPILLSAERIPFRIVIVASFLIAIPGSVLVVGGYWLPRINIHSALYDRVAGWCLAAIGFMSAILLLAAIANSLTNVIQNTLILTALSGGAGFGIGVYDAKARTRAREAEERSRELAYQNAQLEHFAKMLAHELRNPLAIASGYHQQSEPQNEDAAKKVIRAHNRMEEMIDVLLATIEGSRVDIQEKQIPLAELATRVWEDLSVQTKSATLYVDTEQTIRGDPIHIQHLLANLFKSSLKQIEEEAIVRIGELGEGFYIEDNGPGLPGDTYSEVVKTAGISAEERGMGLGLSVVIHIADLYDWDWKITDNEEGGTRVEFTNVESWETSEHP